MFSKYSYHVIIFGDSLGDMPSSESCVVYIKRGVVGVRALGKKQVSLSHREPRPHNRISITIYFYIRLMVYYFCGF